MTPEQIDLQILSAYPDGFQTDAVTPLFPSASLGRCRHWMVDAPEGMFCLRRWPKEQTAIERLQFIQAVLWHAVCEGIDVVPLPVETRKQQGIVRCDDSFWELLPWIDDREEISNEHFQPGYPIDENDETFRETVATEPFQIASAMISLAQFHEATAGFPLPDLPRTLSQGIKERLSRCKSWIGGRSKTLFDKLEASRELPQHEIEGRLAQLGLEFLELIVSRSGNTMVLLSRASRIPLAVQPVIRNSCLRHFRFDDDGVLGIIDFTELGVDSVALDVATLLGSLAGADAVSWDFGLKAYQSIRTLTDNERYLLAAFDVSQAFLEGLDYLDAVFLREERLTLLQLSEIRRRLERLVSRMQQEQRNRRSA